VTTIYYPHYDLESKGLILHGVDHLRNIILLLILSDRVLLQPSHLIATEYNNLLIINDRLSDYIHSGKIVTSIHSGQSSIDEFYREKQFYASSKAERNRIEIRSDYISTHLFDNPNSVFQRDNTKERELFHVVYNDINRQQLSVSTNNRLKHSGSVFEDEFQELYERKGDYLAEEDVNALLADAEKAKKMPRNHIPFFKRNMIGAYYYCGSLANGAITAYNPYFVDLNYDVLSKDIAYKSTNAFNPDFLLDILLGTHIISHPDEITQLSNEDIDIIRNHKSWKEFVQLISQLYDNAFVMENFILQELTVQEKYDKWKSILFNMFYGLTDLTISSVIGLFLQGFLGIGFGVLMLTFGTLFGESKIGRTLQYATVDRIIDGAIRAKEPLYVLTQRIKQRIDGILS